MLQVLGEFVHELVHANITSSVVRASGFFSDIAELLMMAKKVIIHLFDDGQHKVNPIHGNDLSQAFATLVIPVKIKVIPCWLQITLWQSFVCSIGGYTMWNVSYGWPSPTTCLESKPERITWRTSIHSWPKEKLNTEQRVRDNVEAIESTGKLGDFLSAIQRPESSFILSY